MSNKTTAEPLGIDTKIKSHMDEHTAEKVTYFFNNELTPREFSDVLDDVYFAVSQTAIAHPGVLPGGGMPVDEMLYYLHLFKKALAL